MERELLPNLAWMDFIVWSHDHFRVEKNQAVPHEINQAHYAYQGKRKYPLGVRRMARLFEKYRPGHYRMEEKTVFVVPDLIRA